VIPLAPTDVHAWYARIEELLSAHPRDELEAVLTDDERARCERGIARVRDERLVSRALLRHGLSWYTDRSPASWRFEENAYGRPELHDATAPTFNLSHSRGVVAAVFSWRREVGIDVEDTHRRADGEGIDHFLAPRERAALRPLSGDTRRETFFRYWTLKEAYMKARGVGLSLGLDSFTVDLSVDPPTITKRHAAAPSIRWRLFEIALPPRHRLAVAAERDPGEALSFSARSLHAIDQPSPDRD
jgi:4'-phosphopantetheinyl transferase